MNFKKFLCIALMLFSILALAACGGENEPVADKYYTVSFDPQGGSAVSSISVKEGETAIAPTEPSKDGYTFAGWYSGSSEYTFDKAVTADVSLSAKWEKVTYTVTFMDGDNVLDFDLKSYTVEDETVVLPTCSKEHYNFLGWYLDKDFTESAQQIVKGTSGNLTFYAQFTLKNYGITYHLYDGINNEGNMSSYNITSNFPISLAAPTKEGYEFSGWYKDANYTESIASIDGLSGDVVVYAKWEKLPDAPDVPDDPDEPIVKPNVKYTISYKDGATTLNLLPDSYLSGSELALPTVSKDYYDFLGWYTTPTFDDGTKVESITAATEGDLVLYARYEAKVYTITYYLDGGTNSEENIVTYTILDQDFKFKNPEKDGHVFHGWYTDPSFKTHVSSLKGKSGDIVLYAKWVQEGEGGILTPEQPLG